MSRDMNSGEWMENLVRPRQMELDEFERYLSYVRQQAYYEGLTHHLRPGKLGRPFHECPFCSDEVADWLSTHLITCEEVPPELREQSAGHYSPGM